MLQFIELLLQLIELIIYIGKIIVTFFRGIKYLLSPSYREQVASKWNNKISFDVFVGIVICIVGIVLLIAFCIKNFWLH